MTVESPVRSAGTWADRWGHVVLLAVAAVLLGVYADLGQHVKGFWGRLPELGTPWMLLAFAGGRTVARRPAVAALVGFLLIFGGLTSYGLFVHVVHGTELHNVVLGGRAGYWAALAAILGPAAGLAGSGSVSRRALRRTASWGFAVGVPLAELLRVVRSDGYLDLPGVTACLVVLTSLTAIAAVREVRPAPLAASTAVWGVIGYLLARLLLYY